MKNEDMQMGMNDALRVNAVKLYTTSKLLSDVRVLPMPHPSNDAQEHYLPTRRKATSSQWHCLHRPINAQKECILPTSQ
ncbi:hypothetical protein ACLOJK_023865, partial [Asimina triloba]